MIKGHVSWKWVVILYSSHPTSMVSDVLIVGSDILFFSFFCSGCNWCPPDVYQNLHQFAFTHVKTVNDDDWHYFTAAHTVYHSTSLMLLLNYYFTSTPEFRSCTAYLFISFRLYINNVMRLHNMMHWLKLAPHPSATTKVKFRLYSTLYRNDIFCCNLRILLFHIL